MTDLERFHACMNYQPVDRTPFWSWGAWPETIERWKGEGYDPATADLNMGGAPPFDKLRAGSAGADVRQVYGHWFQPHPPFEKTVVEQTDEHILYVNHEGILMREMLDNPMSSMPQFVRFPVETRQDFRRFWAERMQPDLGARIGADWKDQLRAARAQPYPLIVIADRWGGFFGPLRNLVGVERLCTLFYDDPAFLEEMMEADADFIIAMMSQVLDVITIDAFAFWEDMAYRTGPLISPAMVRRYMAPRYARVVSVVRERGVPFIGLDSDGQIDSLIPVWMDAGLNFLYPFEVQAGMDVREVRRKYGRGLRIWGGVDKRTLARGRAAIDAELARLAPLIAEGGYIPHTDHSLPPDVSFDSYRYYMQRLGEACRR